MTRLERVLSALWAVVLAGAVAIFLAIALKTALYPHEVVVSEGAVRLAVESWLDGRPLWSLDRLTTPPFVFAHYTPLYYLLTALVQKGIGPGFLAGRIVSIVFTIGTGVVAGVLVRRLSGSRTAGFGAAALWLSFYPIAFWGTIHRVDAPAIFCEAVGIMAYMTARERGREGWGAVPWFVLAWTAKQVVFVGLVAVILDRLFDRDHGGARSALRWAVAGWTPIFALFALWTFWSGGGFYTFTVLGTVSSAADTPWVILSNSERFFGSVWNVGTFLGAVAALWFGPARRFLGFYLAVGLVLAIAFDANFPRFFSPLLAVAILFPLMLNGMRGQSRLRTFVLASSLFIAFAHFGWEMRPLFGERVLRLGAGNPRVVAAEAVAACTSGTRPVLAQDVGMLLSAGRPVTVADPLVASILVGNDAWSPETLARGIRDGVYEAVVLNRPVGSLNDREWTTLWISGPARRALEERYCLARTVEIEGRWVFLEPVRYLYVPRTASDGDICPEGCP